MVICDRQGYPLSVAVTSASPHEVTLVNQTLDAGFTEESPEFLIGDGAYDSDPLDEQLKEGGITLVAPHRQTE